MDKLMTIEYHTKEHPDMSFFLRNMRPISMTVNSEKDGDWKTVLNFTEFHPTRWQKFKYWVRSVYYNRRNYG